MFSKLCLCLALAVSNLASAANIIQVASGTGNHGVLLAALTKANLETALNATGPFTVFAPTDAAFASALTALNITQQQLLNRSDLADILKYHVLSGNITSGALNASQTPLTLLNVAVTITKSSSEVKFASATVTAADVFADNGVIHVIDKVVLPPADDSSTTVDPGSGAVGSACSIQMNLVPTVAAFSATALASMLA